MILLVDSGSTKSDWVFLSRQGEMIAKTSTQGMNPNVINVQNIPSDLSQNEVLMRYKDGVSYLFFYGSGCGIVDNQQKMKNTLQKFFPKALIEVKDDLTAAAYSAYRGNPAIVGILGTGSNSCFFDGKNIEVKLPSLGYILSDDGGGVALGKAILKYFFMKKLPTDLERDFTEIYHLKIEDFIKNIYHNPKANAYLAGFSKFLHEKKEHPFIQKLLKQEFSNYFEFQILPYPEAKTCEINFIGSIAHYYEDILRNIAREHRLNIGQIVQKPIDNLIKYHKDYIFGRLN